MSTVAILVAIATPIGEQTTTTIAILGGNLKIDPLGADRLGVCRRAARRITVKIAPLRVEAIVPVYPRRDLGANKLQALAQDCLLRRCQCCQTDRAALGYAIVRHP